MEKQPALHGVCVWVCVCLCLVSAWDPDCISLIRGTRRWLELKCIRLTHTQTSTSSPDWLLMIYWQYSLSSQRCIKAPDNNFILLLCSLGIIWSILLPSYYLSMTGHGKNSHRWCANESTSQFSLSRSYKRTREEDQTVFIYSDGLE